ncbi:DUF6625 family protein [Vibrio paucivorans]
MHQVALLIPYYGKLPNYFPFYLNSLAGNEQLQVIFITDIEMPSPLPNNFQVLAMSQQALINKIEQTLSIQTNITKPGKLCDFRPAFGDIFSDELRGYSHWATGDIDVIYGDVFHQLPNDWAQFDTISMLPHWMSGSLSIFKNIAKVNELYKKSVAWREILESSKHFAFDECHGLYKQLRSGANIFDLDQKHSLTYLVKAAHEQGEINAYFSERVIKEKIFDGERVHVSQKRISQQDGREFAYYHLISEKGLASFTIPEWGEIPNQYIIDRNGFHFSEDYGSTLYTLKNKFRGNYQNFKGLSSKVLNKALKLAS